MQGCFFFFVVFFFLFLSLSMKGYVLSRFSLGRGTRGSKHVWKRVGVPGS